MSGMGLFTLGLLAGIFGVFTQATALPPNSIPVEQRPSKSSPKNKRQVDLQLRLRLKSAAPIDRFILRTAKRTVLDVFRHAGVEIVWQECLYVQPGEIQRGICDSSGSGVIQVRLLQSGKPGSAIAGVAYLEEGKYLGTAAEIRMLQVERAAEILKGSASGKVIPRPNFAMCAGLILGVTMAHEIGHLLLGRQAHSNRGIMRPRWNRNDLESAFVGREVFLPQQEERLRANLFSRLREAD